MSTGNPNSLTDAEGSCGLWGKRAVPGRWMQMRNWAAASLESPDDTLRGVSGGKGCRGINHRGSATHVGDVGVGLRSFLSSLSLSLAGRQPRALKIRVPQLLLAGPSSRAVDGPQAAPSAAITPTGVAETAADDKRDSAATRGQHQLVISASVRPELIRRRTARDGHTAWLLLGAEPAGADFLVLFPVLDLLISLIHPSTHPFVLFNKLNHLLTFSYPIGCLILMD